MRNPAPRRGYVRPPLAIFLERHSLTGPNRSSHGIVMTSRDDRGPSKVPHGDPNTISDPDKTPGPASTNPFSQGRSGTTGGTGDVNPSDPTVGTEAWGLGSREKHTTGTGQGQLGRDEFEVRKRNVGEQEKSSGTPEGDDVPVGQRTFRCADAGNADCRWETSARTEDELMNSIERHGREAHGIKNFDADTRRKYQNAIREERAA